MKGGCNRQPGEHEILANFEQCDKQGTPLAGCLTIVEHFVGITAEAPNFKNLEKLSEVLLLVKRFQPHVEIHFTKNVWERQNWSKQVSFQDTETTLFCLTVCSNLPNCITYHYIPWMENTHFIYSPWNLPLNYLIDVGEKKIKKEKKTASDYTHIFKSTRIFIAFSISSNTTTLFFQLKSIIHSTITHLFGHNFTDGSIASVLFTSVFSSLGLNSAVLPHGAVPLKSLINLWMQSNHKIRHIYPFK